VTKRVFLDTGMLVAAASVETETIVAEIRAIRDALSKASGDDIRAIAEAAKARQVQSGRKSVRLPPREVRDVGEAS